MFFDTGNISFSGSSLAPNQRGYFSTMVRGAPQSFRALVPDGLSKRAPSPPALALASQKQRGQMGTWNLAKGRGWGAGSSAKEHVLGFTRTQGHALRHSTNYRPTQHREL